MHSYLYSARLKDLTRPDCEQIWVQGNAQRDNGKIIEEIDLIQNMIRSVASDREKSADDIALVWFQYTDDPFAEEETITDADTDHH